MNLARSQGATYDLIFRGALVLDGTGGAAVCADVAVMDDRIAAVGDLSQARGGIDIDAAGLTLAPGFIDCHTHDDRALLSGPEMAPKASQGVTTVVTGNCGVSIAPLITDDPPAPFDLLSKGDWFRFKTFGEYLDLLDREPAAINAAPLVGHSTYRVSVMDRTDRTATPDEIRQMRRGVEEAIDAGAIGLSTGLAYRPAIESATEETIELCRPVAEAGGIYTTHMRYEEGPVLDSMAESARVGAEAGLPVVLSHHKVSGVENHGRSVETLAYFEELRAGQPIAMDAYPYDASSTALLPEFVERGTRTMITWCVPKPEMTGRYLDEVMAENGWDLDRAMQELQPAGAVYFAMDEADVRRILTCPHCMIGSDGLPHDEHPHPRLWGSFPRVLGHYARDERLFDLAEAVHRMTGLTAANFGLRDRGVIREGAFADLTLFDADTVAEGGDFTDPKRPSKGIHSVYVNGRAVWRDGASTGNRPGRTLRRCDLDPPMRR